MKRIHRWAKIVDVRDRRGAKGNTEWMFGVLYIQDGQKFLWNSFRVINKKLFGPAVRFGTQYKYSLYLEEDTAYVIYEAVIERLGDDVLLSFTEATETLRIKPVTLETYALELEKYTAIPDEEELEQVMLKEIGELK